MGIPLPIRWVGRYTPTHKVGMPLPIRQVSGYKTVGWSRTVSGWHAGTEGRKPAYTFLTLIPTWIFCHSRSILSPRLMVEGGGGHGWQVVKHGIIGTWACGHEKGVGMSKGRWA